MAEPTFQSWQEAFAARLAEQNVNIDASYAPRDPSEAASYWLEGDGTHLAGSALEAYVESWGWETLKPLLEWAIGATEFDPNAHGQATEGEENIDVYPTWVFNLITVADLANIGIDPYNSPSGDQVVALIESGLSDASIWPELDQLLGATSDEERAAFAQAMKSALEQVGAPPAA